jgi:DNA helicase-4
MRNFGMEFGGAFAGKAGIYRTVELGRTFRSVDSIALPARSFVLKNPAQITKGVVPAGTADGPAIRVAWWSKRQTPISLETILDTIQRDDPAASVLLLGRYRHTRPPNLAELQRARPGLKVSFKTIHASKGLEADHVIILRVDAGRLGLPSEIVDDPVLNLVLPEPEPFEHAEERRVFYVALTRARKSITIVASARRPSVFVTELLGSAEYGVVTLGTETTPKHRCTRCGGHMIAMTSAKNRLRFVCEHRELCGASLSTCQSCRKDIPDRGSSNREISRCSCGASYPICPSCSDGWLIERHGKFGKFVGCVNYPRCSGKGNSTTQASQETPRRLRGQSGGSA